MIHPEAVTPRCVLDLVLPANQATAKTPVTGLSGHDDADARERALTAGAKDAFSPVRPRSDSPFKGYLRSGKGYLWSAPRRPLG